MRQILKTGVQGVFHKLGYHIAPHAPYDEASVTEAKLSTWKHGGTQVSFLIVDEIDNIQSNHLHQKFYAQSELDLISESFPNGGVFLDVGANVGNHSIYAAAVLGASRVFAIEPNPDAYRILRANIGLNGLQDRIAHFPVGLSDRSFNASAEVHGHNLGGAKLAESEAGRITVVTGDSICSDMPIDFIKIDTEGMEIGVLRGLSTTIARCRPKMFIEVANSNLDVFHDERLRLKYDIVAERPSLGCVNILAHPRGD